MGIDLYEEKLKGSKKRGKKILARVVCVRGPSRPDTTRIHVWTPEGAVGGLSLATVTKLLYQKKKV